MKKRQKQSRIRKLIFLFLFFFGILDCIGKSEVLVIDSVTGEALPITIIRTIRGKKETLITDSTGRLILPSRISGRELKVSSAGYKEATFRLPAKDTFLIIKMIPSPYELEEVIIKPQKTKYSKKNNPAVDFINRLRLESHKYNPADTDYYSYDKYEKTLISINNFKGNADSGFLAKKAPFIKEYVDTSSLTGSRLLNLILKEKFGTRIISKEPKADKEIIWAYKSEGIDDAMNQENVRVLLEDVIREVDLYKGDINILQNRFVSPLSPIGPDFYRYYLTDTVYIGDEKCVELSFVPRNAESMGFNGKLYVPLNDTTMFVKKVIMRTPHDINLNFLNNLYVNQSYYKDSVGNHHKVYDDVVVEMQIIKGTPEFYGRKTTFYDNFSYEERPDLREFYKKKGFEFDLTDSVGATAEFWDEKRMVPLSRAEYSMANMAPRLRKIKLFYWAEKVIRLMENGYFTTWKPSKFDIGPLNTFVSYNDVEGVRLRLGGMTMAALNPHIFFKGYGAYGTKDHKWKYSGEIQYSFSRKKKHFNEWPKHGVYGSYKYDLNLLGQHYLFTNQDNVFLSLKRKESILVTYQAQARLGYVVELPENFSIEAGVEYNKEEGTRWIPFVFSNGKSLPYYRQASFNVTLRWARGEKFIQGRNDRRWVNMDPWILQLTHEYGPKGLFRSAFTTNRTEFSVQKRFWFSAFGYLDVIAKAGKVWQSVYFPALLWPNANLSYTIQPESYSLMNAMEFANDAYASIDFTYFGNGVLFNHLPGIKKLKLREAITFKGLMGSLSRKNNPAYNTNLPVFPSDTHSTEMTSTPYMEVGAGIDNIFSVLRVDYVWRLTYRHRPDIDKSGIRISLHFTL